MQTQQKTAGTFRIEGMLQGPQPVDGSDYEAKVEAWLKAAKSKGLGFSLDRSGGQLSLLADNRPVQSSALAGGGGVGASLQVIFESLLECFPLQHRMELFSTFRSVEYRPGSEVQTIFAVAPPGTIQFQEREVDAKTVAPPPELSGAGKAKVAALGLLTVLLIGAIGWFVFKPQLKKAAGNLTNLKVEDVTLDSAAYDDFISVTKQKVDKRKGGLVVEVTRGEKWEASVADGSAAIPADLDWNTMLAVQSLRRGYVRCELFDADGKLIGSTELRLKGLLGEAGEEKTSSLIALPQKVRPKTIRLVH